MEIHQRFLRIPLGKLYHIDSLNDFTGLSARELELFVERYEPEDVRSIIAAVKWVVQNSSFDFPTLLPDLKKSNEEIGEYLVKIEKSFDSLNI